MRELILEVSLHVPDPGSQIARESLEGDLNKIGHKMIAAACSDDVQWTATQVRILKGRVESPVKKRVSSPLTINIVILTVLVSVLGVIAVLSMAERIDAERGRQRNAQQQSAIEGVSASVRSSNSD